MLMALSRFFCWLPLSLAMGIAQAIAAFWYYLVPLRRGVARRNVERVFGQSLSAADKRRIVRRCFTHLCMYAVEELRLPALTADVSAQLVARQGFDNVDGMLAQNRGVIAVTAHLGHFDLLGCSQTVRGYPVHAILKDIKWSQGHKLWNAVRDATKLGRVAPRKSWGAIKELLERNQIVAFLIDQHMAKHRAIVCEFFGQLASTTPAPVRMAFETGAPIMPIFITRTAKPGHHLIRAFPQFMLETPYESLDANIRHNTERLNRMLEGLIRQTPEQWLWLHKRWKVQDSPEGWEIPASLQHLVGSPR